MKYQVEKEDPREIAGELQGILEATRDVAIHPRRVEWLYTKNPFGDATVWVLRDPGGKIAGYTAGLPRPVRVGTEMRRSWMGADFSILPAHRTLGPAMMLRRVASKAIDRNEADLLTCFPNTSLASVHRRLGQHRLGRLARFARPLRVEPQLPRWLSALLSPVADPLLRLRGKRHRPRSTTRIVERLEFDDRFDRLFESTEHQSEVVALRDSRFLSWRYGRNPEVCASAVLAEDDAGLAGYLIFIFEDNVFYVQDALARRSPEIYDDLFSTLLTVAGRRRVNSVSMFLGEGHPLIRIVRDHGFVEREHGPDVYVYSRPDDPLRPVLYDPANWFLTVGDRDV